MIKRVTIADIARAAGVSNATVSYFINGHYENMSDEVRHRLEGIVKELGYRPNNLARGLKSKDTKSVGLIIPGLYGQIAFRVVAGACKALDEAGYTVSVMISNEDIAKEREYIAQCLANQVSGIIVVPSMTYGETNIQYLKKVHESGTPIVVTTRCSDEWPYDGARLNYAQSMDDMVRHFYEKGYKKVALFLDVLDGPYITFTKGLRRKLFLEAIKKYYGVDGSDSIWYGIKSEKQAINAMSQFISKNSDVPKAVFAVNSPTLGMTLQAARECKASVPNDLGIGGYGGWDWTFYTEPTLTTITQPLDKVGEAAANLMLRRLENPKCEPKKILLDSKLIPCQSTNLKVLKR